jgi:hypothetical protein
MLLLLTWFQVRWLTVFSVVSWISLALAIGGCLADRTFLWRRIGQGALATMLVWALIEVGYVADRTRSLSQNGSYSPRFRIYTQDKYQSLEFASRIDSASVGVLSHFDMSAALQWYGKCRVVSSLYWENLEGMRAAAEILGASNDLVAQRMLGERGITHLMVWADDRSIYAHDLFLNDKDLAGSRRERGEVFLGRLAEGRKVAFLVSEPWMERMEQRVYRIDGRPLPDRSLVVRKVISPGP